MAPAKSKWDEEDDSTPPSSPPTTAAVPRRSKFDDEEEDSDVIESWDAAEDSEEEAKKAKEAAERKAKADAIAAANKKSKAQRVAERAAARKKLEEEEDTSSEEEEDEADRRARLRQTEQDADLGHAEDLFGNIGISTKRSAAKPVVVAPDPKNPAQTIDLSALPLFNPNTKDGFTKLRETLVPIIAANGKKAQYTLFLGEFCKQLAKELTSEETKKIGSALTTLSNEKMKEEKNADKGGKKTKAAKNKKSLNANRDTSLKADTTAYEDGLDDGDDFM
ncbi:MAG: Translation initiation factor 3 subunit J component [Thelocarpon superellum]|nr:MAG: Translation initiation factor 3 subunit J component [Thelocarpon superellum]